MITATTPRTARSSSGLRRSKAAVGERKWRNARAVEEVDEHRGDDTKDAPEANRLTP